MWELFTGALMCYLFGFLCYCCYSSTKKRLKQHPSSFDPENPSTSTATAAIPISATLRPDGSVSTTLVHESTPSYRRRLGLDILLQPIPLHDDEPTTRCLNYDTNNNNNQNYNGEDNEELFEYSTNSDLPQSALAAKREQQLRQIKLEINELSRRLGIGQIYRDRQLYPSHTNPSTPLGPRRVLSTTEGNGRRRRTRRRRTMRGSENEQGESGDEETNNRDNNEEQEENEYEIVDSSSSSSTEEGEEERERCLSSSSSGINNHLNLSSSATRRVQTITGRSHNQNHQLSRQRQRRLRLIRMEIEDLTQQLTSLSVGAMADSPGGERGTDRSSLNVRRGRGRRGRMRQILFDQDEDESASLDARMNMHLSLGDLPSYDDTLIDGDYDESPPPSYAQLCFGLDPLKDKDFSRRNKDLVVLPLLSSHEDSSRIQK